MFTPISQLQPHIQQDIVPAGLNIKSVVKQMDRNIQSYPNNPNIENASNFQWAQNQQQLLQQSSPQLLQQSSPQLPSHLSQFVQNQNELNCQTIMNHIEHCKICSKIYKRDESKYMSIIIILILLNIFLITKIIDKNT